MKISKVSHVSSAQREASRWTAKDTFILQLMAGTSSYEEIALALGRSEEAVQRKASRMGLKIREKAASEAAAEKFDRRLAEAARLSTPAADLSEFLVECDEEPAEPRPGSRTYHRNYKQRRKQEETT